MTIKQVKGAPRTMPPRTQTESSGAVTSTSTAASAPPAPDESRSVARARATLSRLGQKVSLRPAPEVPVADRAGKTAALQGGATPGAQTFAAIDLGSSSGKLLVQRREPSGAWKTLVDQKIGAALGKGVENGGVIPAENQARALAALKAFVAIAKEHGVDAADIPVITTAVVRNAQNGGAFLSAIHGLGLSRARVLSGDEEAAMGFQGALAMLGGAPGRYATLDLGGGSFQMAVGTERGVEDGASTQVGSNRVLDGLLAPHKDAAGRLNDAAFARADAALKSEAPMPLSASVLEGRTLVATGGVSKFLRAHLGTDVITRDQVDALRRSVGALSEAERIAVVQGGKDEATQQALGVETAKGALEYGQKLPASATLLLHILDSLSLKEVRVSETDARHALVLKDAPRKNAPLARENSA
jgi:exopolyphosphatase/pppGpp-phosphohydrolase